MQAPRCPDLAGGLTLDVDDVDDDDDVGADSDAGDDGLLANGCDSRSGPPARQESLGRRPTQDDSDDARRGGSGPVQFEFESELKQKGLRGLAAGRDRGRSG
eukprot:60729-Rhodomonas_salina.2